MESLHNIDILGDLRCLASYKLNELGRIHNSRADFIYGECYCPFLEDPEQSCVTNEREKLVNNDMTLALRAWIVQQIEALAEQMAAKHQSEQKNRDLQQSSQSLAILDSWKNQFLSRLPSTLFGGPSNGDTFGGSGASSGGSASNSSISPTDTPIPIDSERVINEGNEGNRGGESSEGTGGGAGTEQRKGSSMPRVLLSGHDLDPLDLNSKKPFNCDERHPPVYQREQDIPEGIFWINTSRPLAEKILKRFGAESARWREYLFQRVAEIILKQQIHREGKLNPHLTADGIDILMDKVISLVHDQAAKDLEEFLFEDSLINSGSYSQSCPRREVAENDIALIER